MNKIIITGNLARGPETSATQNGVAVCRLSVAVQRDFANSDGQRVADFFNVVVWRAQAENCGKYLKKGSKVGIVGSLQNRTFEDRDGNKRTVTEIIASDVEFLSPKEQDEPEVVTAKRVRLEEIEDNDFPF